MILGVCVPVWATFGLWTLHVLASQVAQRQRICLQCKTRRRYRFDPWAKKIPWRRAWQIIPVFLPGESRGQRSLVGYSSQGHKELDTTEVTEHACMLSTRRCPRGSGCPQGSLMI